MLKVSKQQMAAFSKYLLEDFEKNATLRLRKKFPSKTKEMTDENLHKIIRDGIVKAESYNIIKKEDVMIYIEYMIFYGNDFDVNSATGWATKILRIRNLKGSEKVTRLTGIHPLIPESE